MSSKIIAAMTEFHNHLLASLGQPIGLPTLGAFANMMLKIVTALSEGDS